MDGIKRYHPFSWFRSMISTAEAKAEAEADAKAKAKAEALRTKESELGVES